MQSTPNIESLIPSPENITKFAYETFQQGKSVFSLGHKTVSNLMTETLVPKRKQEIKSLPQQTQLQLLEKRNQLLVGDLCRETNQGQVLFAAKSADHIEDLFLTERVQFKKGFQLMVQLDQLPLVPEDQLRGILDLLQLRFEACRLAVFIHRIPDREEIHHQHKEPAADQQETIFLLEAQLFKKIHRIAICKSNSAILLAPSL